MVLPEGLVLGGFPPDDRGPPCIPSQAGVQMKLTVRLRSQAQCLGTSHRELGLLSVLLTLFILVRSAMKRALLLPFLLCAHELFFYLLF